MFCSWPILCGLFSVFVVSRIIQFRASVQKTGRIPGMRCAFSPICAFGGLLPTFCLNPGLNWQWEWRNKVYQKYNTETISVVPFLLGPPAIYTSSMEVARQIVSTKGQFEKAEELTEVVLTYGRNIFGENGSEWKRHRRIMNPAFGPKTYSLVWDETIRIYHEMTAVERWDGKKYLTVSAINDLTTKLTLIIISRCGFGHPIPWEYSMKSKASMTFAEALSVVSGSLIAKLLIPKWIYRLPIQRLRDIDTASTTLMAFMRTLIDTRRNEFSSGDEHGEDVFSLMIRASETEGKLAMNDEELTGNTFLLLFAGRDTTAHTLDATIGLLALYEDIQEDVYQQIQSFFPNNAQPLFCDLPRLEKVQACYLEATRLFPAVTAMIRDTAENVVLTMSTHDASISGQIALESGTRLVVDIIGISHNSRYFPEPEEFRPSRWYGVRESDVPMFSFGSRACIGRRFAITEAVCFLTLLLQEWKLEIILNPGETREEWRERVLKASTTLTLGVGKLPVRLIRR